MEFVKVKNELTVDYLLIVPPVRVGHLDTKPNVMNQQNCTVKLQKFDTRTSSKLKRTQIFENFLKCEFCEKIFRFHEKADIWHKRICKNFKKPRKLFCDLCKYSTMKRVSLENHLTRHLANSRQHPCIKCGQIFQYLSELVRHQNCKRISKCLSCNVNFSCKLLLVKHNKITHDGKFKCPQCPFSCVEKKILTVHIKGHNFRFYCECCGFATSWRKNFLEHQKLRQHGQFSSIPIELFQCDRCEKFFKLKHQLNRHKITTHVDLKFLTCQICMKVSASKMILQTHIQRVHEGMKRAKKCQCDLCSVATVNRSQMKVHMQTHLKEGRKMFICDKCGLECLTKTSIHNHLVSEKTNECSYCGIKFKCRKLRDRHLEEDHNATKTFWPCQTCSKSYKKEEKLNRHQQNLRHGQFAAN
jgi:hypothetical protein